MTAERKRIEIDDSPELLRIVGEVRRTNASIALVRNGEVQAIVDLPDHTLSQRVPLTETDWTEFKKSAGAWAGLMDADELIARIDEGRSMPPRELPELP
jgi:hypothetical protein